MRNRRILRLLVSLKTKQTRIGKALKVHLTPEVSLFANLCSDGLKTIVQEVTKSENSIGVAGIEMSVIDKDDSLVIHTKSTNLELEVKSKGDQEISSKSIPILEERRMSNHDKSQMKILKRFKIGPKKKSKKNKDNTTFETK